ncbi:hypothetical protein Syun_026403 [Stephania yunnanensis]|uniref:Uncharacterized protein n=1 Tax=Stephania yunnanensis TaxID=152371 RepID=A0AAP0HS52_9MAGN
MNYNGPKSLIVFNTLNMINDPYRDMSIDQDKGRGIETSGDVPRVAYRRGTEVAA